MNCSSRNGQNENVETGPSVRLEMVMQLRVFDIVVLIYSMILLYNGKMDASRYTILDMPTVFLFLHLLFQFGPISFCLKGCVIVRVLHLFGHLFRRGRSIQERIVEVGCLAIGCDLLWFGLHGESNDSIAALVLRSTHACFGCRFPAVGCRLSKGSTTDVSCRSNIGDLL